MKNKTKKNIEKLAKTCVDQMDLEEVCAFAQGHLEVYYAGLSREEFNEDWNLIVGEE